MIPKNGRGVIRRSSLPPVPKQTRPPRVGVNFRLDPQDRDDLRRFCDEDGINVTDLLRGLVEDWLTERRQADK